MSPTPMFVDPGTDIDISNLENSLSRLQYAIIFQFFSRNTVSFRCLNRVNLFMNVAGTFLVTCYSG